MVMLLSVERLLVEYVSRYSTYLGRWVGVPGREFVGIVLTKYGTFPSREILSLTRSLSCWMLLVVP